MSRLATTTAVAVMLLWASGASAQATSTPGPLPPPDMTSAGVRAFLQIAEPVVEGVTVLRQAKPNFYGVVGNVTIIEQSDGLVLIDSGSSYGSGRRVVELVRGVSPKPVKAVIVTHWHNDHPLGLAAIVEAWPQTEVLASAEAARDFDARINRLIPRGAPNPAYDGSRFAPVLEQALKDSAEATDDGVRRGHAEAAEALLLLGADQVGTFVMRPTRIVADGARIDDPDRPVEIRQLGRGNTDGDLVMWLPNQRIVVAGDVVVWPVPYEFNVYPREWAAVLERIKAMPFDRLIPGHGEVLTDRVYLDRLIGLQAAVETMVKAAVAEGLTEEQVVEQTPERLAEQRRLFAGDDAWLGYWFDGYAAQPLAQSSYREVTGAPIGPPPPAN